LFVLIETVAETPRGGAVERTYRVVDGAAGVTREQAAARSVDEHVEALSVFAASLVETATARLREAGVAEVVGDGLGSTRAVVHLRDDEFEDCRRQLDELVPVAGAGAAGPLPGR
jgi:hypothetical protein